MFRVVYSAETFDKKLPLMPKNKLPIYFLLSCIVAGMFACTTTKDGFTYRVFHNTTARYNGYFYAKEAIKEGQANIVEAHVEDYDIILPVFIYGDETTAQASFAQMERAIEKSSLVIERHKMDVPKRSARKRDRPELNKWIDDNYLLIGQSYFFKRNFFKAEEMFLYVTRKYKEKDIQMKGTAWLARCYMETEQWTKAKNALLKAEQIKEVEDEVKADVHLVFADYYIRQADFEKAAEQLEKSLRYIKKKKDRARPTFILAQLMQEMNRSQDAITYYEAVLSLRPEYEMEFYARINQAMAYDRRGGNAEQIKEQLFKMLKDDKNIEYRDQIYYALAELELEDRNRETGIDYLLLSLDEPNGKPKQRTKSFLRLADLYLDDREYQDAQAYYDSTFKSISEEHPRYLDVKNKAESLTDLVENLILIEYEDSLQAICALSEEDKVKKLNSVIADMRAELVRQEEERQARMAALAAGGDNAAQGDFWPWNPQLKAIGKQNFDQYWGSRPLEDNWRRSNKLQQSFGEGEDIPEITEETTTDTGNDIDSQLPTVDELLSGLPCAPAQIEESDQRIAEAFYNAGVVYKEKLDDVENAIERWEVLVTRYETSAVHPTAYYQLYRTYLYREQEEGYSNPFCGTCNSPYWSNIILDKYPGSDWARLIQNPGYEDIAEIEKAEQHAAYEALYNRYNQRAYQEVILEASKVINEQPQNHFLCKYRILKAFAVGNMDAMTGSTASYLNELREVIKSCPDTEEAVLAQEVINNINGEVPAPVVEETPDAPKEEEEIFDYDPSDRHYFAVIFPVEGGGDVNNIKALVSDFDSKYFKSNALKVSSNLLDRQNQIVLVKTFNKLDDAKNYYTTFLNNDNELKEINSGDYTLVLISKNNYVTLFKSKAVDAYASFFERYYEF